MQVYEEGEYRLHYEEDYNTVLVWKGAKLSYQMFLLRNGNTVAVKCSCPSGTYRNYCKHERMVARNFKLFLKQRPLTPEDKLNEEYVRDWLSQKYDRR